ncbi:MAG: hypothetical protein WC518_00325 [Patescibacteria group bacterium]
MSDNLAHQLNRTSRPAGRSLDTLGLRGLAGATKAAGAISPNSRAGRMTRVAGLTLDKIAQKISSRASGFPLAQQGAIGRAKAGAKNFGDTLGVARRAANASIIGSGGLKDSSSQAAALRRKQEEARLEKRREAEGYLPRDKENPYDLEDIYDQSEDWGGAGEDTNANLFSDSEEETETEPQTEAGEEHKKNIAGEPAEATDEEEKPAGETGAKEKEGEKKDKKDKKSEKAEGEKKGEDDKKDKKPKEDATGKKDEKNGDLKSQAPTPEVEEENKKESEKNKSKEKEADKLRQTTEQRIQSAREKSRNNFKQAASLAASLKISDAKATVNLAVKQESAAILTSMWGAVWLDWTTLTLWGLNLYLATTLFTDKIADFGEDYLIGRWLPKELAKWTEIIILAIINGILFSIIALILYVGYRIYNIGLWGGAMIWLAGALPGGNTAVQEAAQRIGGQ